MNVLLFSLVWLTMAQDNGIPVGRWVSVDEIQPKLEHPEPPPPASDEAATNDAHVEPLAEPVPVVAAYYVIKFTAPNCPPCATWDRVERPKLEAAGIRIDPIDVSLAKNQKTKRDYGVTSLPRFMIATETTKKIVLPNPQSKTQHYVGYTSAEFIIAKINGLNPPSKSTERRNLKQLIADDMKLPSAEWWYEGEGTMYDHCVWHGWPRDEVMKLTLAEATRLHAATHEGRLKP